MTVPPSAVARIAPPSQPGTSTHTTVTSAGPPAAVTASRRAIGSRASATVTASAMPAPVRRSCSPWWGTTPMVRAAPAARAAAEAEGAGLAGTADDRDHGLGAAGDVLLHDAGGERGRSADVHHAQRERRVEVVGDDRGDRPAEEHGVAVARHLLARAVPAREAVLDDERGEGEAHQGRDAVADLQAEGRLGADLLDGADEHAAGAGHGVLHLAARADDLEDLGAHAVAVGLAEARGGRARAGGNDAASRLSRSTRTRTSSGHSSARVSRRCAACGSTVVSSRTRCSRSGHQPPGPSGCRVGGQFRSSFSWNALEP